MSFDSFYLKFEDVNENVVLEGTTNEFTGTYTIPSDSSGDTDLDKYPDYNVDPTGETKVDVWVNAYIVKPTPITNNYMRLSTEDTYNSVTLTDKYNGIRITFSLTHSGNTHVASITSFQKYCGQDDQGQDVWTGLWTANPETMSGSWNSASEEEGYIAFYYGTVNGKTPQSQRKKSIGIQFIKYYQGNYLTMSRVYFWELSAFNPIPSPDDTYEPTDNVRIGGRGNGNYPSNAAETPNIDLRNTYMSFGSPNGKGLTYYITEIEDLIKAFTKIYSSSYMNEEARMNAMIDAFKIPDLSYDGQNIQHFWIADVSVSVNHSYIMTTRFAQYDMGTVDLSNYGWDDYNDFKNTRASLLLPFVGRINISIDSIARGSIRVLAVMDRYTGNVAYWIYTRSMQAEREVLYGVYEGQSAIQIPFGGTHYVNMMGKFVSVGASVAGLFAGIAAENPLIVAGGASALVKSMTSLTEQGVDTTHQLSSTGAATTQYQVRLDIERREMLRPEQYRELASIPSFITIPVRQLDGFIKVHTADYSGLKCEQSEKEIIKAMLEEGVYV